MFVLRRITSEANELNDCIGERYHLVLKERNKDEYEKSLKALKWEDDNELYGFVIYSFANEMVHCPLYKKSVYFIMTESGQTFANISQK